MSCLVKKKNRCNTKRSVCYYNQIFHLLGSGSMRTKPMFRITKQATNEISSLMCQPCVLGEYHMSFLAHNLKIHRAKTCIGINAQNVNLPRREYIGVKILTVTQHLPPFITTIL